MGTAPSERGVIDGLLSPLACAELRFILGALGVRGNRQSVESATIHDVANARPEYLMPLAAARERVRESVEELFGREMELFPEFTALMAWGPGSSIGWHYDSNRDYLSRRHYSAVLYLSSSGSDFWGGDLRFRGGSPQVVVPRAGQLVAYSAGQENVHCVETVTRGSRETLTMWFSLDASALEDTEVLAALRRSPAVPLGLPDTMYERDDGTDIRPERLARLGLSVSTPGDGCPDPAAVWVTRSVGRRDRLLCKDLASATEVAFFGLVEQVEAQGCSEGSLFPDCARIVSESVASVSAREDWSRNNSLLPGGDGDSGRTLACTAQSLEARKQALGVLLERTKAEWQAAGHLC